MARLTGLTLPTARGIQSYPCEPCCSRRSRHELDAAARRGRRGRTHLRRRTARRASRASARASTRAGASSPSRSRACATSSPTTAAQLESLGAERTLLVATSAVRDAENGEAFLGEIEWSYGFTTRLLSGRRRGGADVARRPAERTRGRDADRRHRRRLDRARRGASTTSARSLDIGSVRLTERFLHSDPPTEAELDDAAAAVRALLVERVPTRSAARRAAIGVAGTVTSTRGARPRPRGVRPRARARTRAHARRRSTSSSQRLGVAAARRAARAARARAGARTGDRRAAR